MNKADSIIALSRVGFGSAHLSAVWPDDYLTLLPPVKNLEEKGANSVFLSGLVGKGKTSLLACFCRVLFQGFADKVPIEAHLATLLFARRAVYLTHTELSKYWEREFQDDSGGNGDEFWGVPILFLDDMGTAPDTNSHRNMAKLENLIDYRWRNHKKTFIASNLSLAEFKKPARAEWFRIARRLSEKDWMTYIELKTRFGGKE